MQTLGGTVIAALLRSESGGEFKPETAISRKCEQLIIGQVDHAVAEYKDIKVLVLPPEKCCSRMLNTRKKQSCGCMARTCILA
jgi:hypothetical protein